MLHSAERLVRVTGHRGNPRRAPENSMAAFRAALEEGADAIETDVRLSADNVPVLIHDEDLLRVAGSPARVADMTAAELQTIELTGGGRAPTLAELADLCRGRAALNLDLKIEGTLPAIAATLAATGFPVAEVTVCAWTGAQAQDARTHLPGCCLAYIVEHPLERDDDAWFADLAATGFGAVSLDWNNLTPAQIDRAHRAGLTVMTWTVNDLSDARAALTAGVDDIITDDPAALYAALHAGETA